MKPAQSKIGIVGPGAIGGWLAARLGNAGHDVRLLARGPTRAAIASGGIELEEGDEELLARPTVTDDAGDLGPVDLLILAVKAPSLAGAAEAARPMIGTGTAILPMVNGVPWWFADPPLRSVDPDGRIAAALPADRLVGCVVHASAARTAPNRVRVNHVDHLILGEPGGGISARVAALVDLFDAAGVPAIASADVRGAIWYKLWGNATLNPLSALTRATAERLLGDPAIRAFMLAAMAELSEVGAAIGCPIAQSGEDRMAVTARLGAFKTSMLQDVEAGRPIELEALVGAPRELADRAGVATPALDLIHALTAQLAGAQG